MYEASYVTKSQCGMSELLQKVTLEVCNGKGDIC